MDDEKKRPLRVNSQKLKKHKWTIAFTACITAFTVFISLDTFVLSSAYQTNATQMNLAMIQEQAKAQESAQEKAQGKTREKTQDEAQEKTREKTQDEARGETREKTQDEAQGKTREKTQDEAQGKTQESTRDAESSGGDPQGSGKPSADQGAPSSPFDKEGSDSQGGFSSSGRKKHHRPSRSGSGAGPGADKGFGAAGGSGSASFNEEEAARSAAEVTTQEADAGSTQTYQDDNMKITYQKYTTNGTTVHVADIQVSSVEYLKTAFANDTYGKNVAQSTSDIAAAHNAILAINGDYYGVQERGYVIRNGIVYRDKADSDDVLCIYADGSMKVVDPSTVTAQELVEQGVWQAFSFGPGLIEDGQISVSLSTEVGRAKASNPRTAIGILDDLHYVFVVSDGRSGENEGLSLYELSSFMQQLGAKTAYNLDGGGSSTMVFQGEVMNDPSDGFQNGEREVSDIVYIG